jgi:threonyl-tRNA synthetase
MRGARGLRENAELEFLTGFLCPISAFQIIMPKNEALDRKRHSLAHLMAACIQEMFPEAKFGVGPVIEEGFYYDVYGTVA